MYVALVVASPQRAGTSWDTSDLFSTTTTTTPSTEREQAPISLDTIVLVSRDNTINNDLYLQRPVSKKKSAKALEI